MLETNAYPEPVDLSQKRKILQSELDVTDSVSTTSSIKIRKQLNNTSHHLETDQVENQSKRINNIEFDNDLHLPSKIPPTTKHEPKENNQNDCQIQSSTLSQDWWQASCQIACISCNAQVLTEETSAETTCDDWGEEQYVVSPFCDKDSNQRFSIKMNERYTKCCVCKSDMMPLPCCNLFQPIQQLDNNLFEFLKCAKYSIICVCQNVNMLPP